jgi:integrase/recombinase XerD
MTEMSPLRRRMIEDMTVRNLSPATQRSYVYAVAKFSRFFGRSPSNLGLEDVRAFQVHLVAAGVSWPALNQTVCALRFLYGITLKQAELPERIPHARTPRKLPVVLSADEVVAFLEAVPSLKARAALTTAYAAGLRASEAAGIKVADIDSRRMVIRIEHDKGGRDRYVMLSPQLHRHPEVLLETEPAGSLAVSGSGRQAPDQPDVAACRLPLGVHRRRPEQAGDRAHVAAQLCHTSLGERHRHPHHPGSARAQQPKHHGALHPGGDQHHPRHGKPARSPAH